ncbi:MAG TPA: ATP-binding protein [Burkholderiaceae bacterium]|nr:ATP-binding protein [Burkholderiaceae bacterium]
MANQGIHAATRARPAVPAYRPRTAAALLHESLDGYPVVAVTGPRQAGKSTLLAHELAGWNQVTLEDPDVRAHAREDPRGFLARNGQPLVIDEAQHAPELFSYLQTVVDRRAKPGQYVLSGSQNLALSARITQSLAGRVGLVELLPFSTAELDRSWLESADLNTVLWTGGFPAIHARHLDPARYHANYTATYVERDVRQLTQVHDLLLFQRFLRLCAGRIGQLINLSALAADTGISQPTANAWMSVLEAGYVVRRLAPYYANFGKRLVKAPKLYFIDTGLAAWLLGIQSPATLDAHPLRGPLFENWVIVEAIKHRVHRGDMRPLYFWRDNIGTEVDLLLEEGTAITGVEIKSGQTLADDMVRSLLAWQRHTAASDAQRPLALVYGGSGTFQRWGVHVTGWRELAALG